MSYGVNVDTLSRVDKSRSQRAQESKHDRNEVSIARGETVGVQLEFVMRNVNVHDLSGTS